MRRPPPDERVWLKRSALMLVGASAVAALATCAERSAPADQPAPQAPGQLHAWTEAKGRIQDLRSRFPRAFGPDEATVSPLGVASSTKTATVDLPPSAAGAVRLTDGSSHLSLTFALTGAADVPIEVVDGTALYRGAAPGGGDILHRLSTAGTEDFVLFKQEPALCELRYEVDVSGVAGLRLVSNTLEFLDQSGTPRLRVAPPYVLDATGSAVEIPLNVDGCAVDIDPRPPWGRPVTNPGALTCTVKVAWQKARVRYPLLVDPTWIATKNMVRERTWHAIAMLPNPKSPPEDTSPALLTGGFDKNGAVLQAAEVYEPLSRTFATTGDMNVGRAAHTATRLSTSPIGQVFVAGGATMSAAAGSPPYTPLGGPVGSTELYSPQTGTFTPGPAMTDLRFNHTATLLVDGRVLLVGGIADFVNQPTKNADLFTFDPAMPPGTIQPTDAMNSARSAHAAARFGAGDVLITGGIGSSSFARLDGEIFCVTCAAPNKDTFIPIPAPGPGLIQQMHVGRAFHTATTLSNGEVLIVGGINATIAPVGYANTAERYQSGASSGFRDQVVTMSGPRAFHTVTLLNPGALLPAQSGSAVAEVLLAGGFDGAADLKSTEAYFPTTASIQPLAGINLGIARRHAASILINAGDSSLAGKGVLITGGTVGMQATKTAEILSKPLGEPCLQDGECLSGHCAVSNLQNPNAGKMCCDTACNEVCKSCSALGKGSGVDGVCGFASDTTEIGWTCVPKVNQEVEILQGCDGKGNVIPFASNKCPPNTCDGNRCGKICNALLPCSDAGYCTDAAVEAGPSQDGGGGAGGGGSTSASGAGGAGGGSTSSTSGTGGADAGQGLHCEDRKPNGLACTEGRQCHSGYCVDGYCCNVACTGQCEACDVMGKIGFCTPAGTLGPEPPHTAGGSIDFKGTLTPRKPCDGTGTGCEGSCKGVQTNVCIYPGSEKTAKPSACALDGAGYTTTSFSCDGKGNEVATPASCAGFKCESATACKTACTTDDDCITDYVCLLNDAGMNTCQLLTGPLCDGDHTLRKPMAQGGNKACPDHYTCPAGSDSCRNDCDSVADCVDNFVCNAERKCVEQLPAPPVPSCSCRAAAADEDASVPWTLAVGALALGAAARRRRRWV